VKPPRASKRTWIVPAIVDRVHPCPGCGARLNAISGTSIPEAGDFSVCAECISVLRFEGKDFACRLATLEELEQEIAAGELDEKDADVLRGCFAEQARRKGVSI
jgi:hypothetical protein